MQRPPTVIVANDAPISAEAYQSLLVETYSHSAILKEAPVFSIRTKKERVNRKVRRSMKATFHSSAVCTIVDAALQTYAAGQPWGEVWRMQLLGTDTSYLRYETGDYFHAHRDYTKMSVPNALYGYTLIIGLHGATEGGDTHVQTDAADGTSNNNNNNNNAPNVSWAAQMGNLLLFDATMCHWADTVVRGIKEVLVFDVWCVRKTSAGSPLQNCHHDVSALFQSRLHSVMTRFQQTVAAASSDDGGGVVTQDTPADVALFHTFLDGNDTFSATERSTLYQMIDYVMCGMTIPAEVTLPTLRSALLTMQQPGATMWSSSPEESIALRSVFQTCPDVVEVMLLYVSVTHMDDDYNDDYDPSQQQSLPQNNSKMLSAIYLNGHVAIAMRRSWLRFLLVDNKDEKTPSDMPDTLVPLTIPQIDELQTKFGGKPNAMAEMHAQLFGASLTHNTDIAYADADADADGYAPDEVHSVLRLLPTLIDASCNNLQHCDSVARYYTWLKERYIFYEDDCNDESGGVGSYYSLPYVRHNGYALSAYINIST
jgi:hypothetical protein